MSPDLIVPLVLNASSVVLILLLVASGLYIVFGLMGVINLAHGEFFMLGAYSVVIANGYLGLNPWWGMLISIILLAAVGYVIEWSLIRFLYRNPLDTVLATWGLSIILVQVARLIFGKEFQYIDHPLPGSITILGSDYPLYRIVVMGLAVLIMGVSYYLLQKTVWGMHIRAAIDNPDLADALGIDTRQIYRMTFAYGAAIAGLAGALIAPIISIRPEMGLDFVLDAFFVVIVGGLGQVTGIIAGSALIGSLQSLISFFANPVVARISVLVLSILIIQWRPQGLVKR